MGKMDNIKKNLAEVQDKAEKGAMGVGMFLFLFACGCGILFVILESMGITGI